MKALLIVDIQNDFLPGGALGVKGGDKVIPLINDLAEHDFDLVIASKDWHPKNHGSFAKSHGKRPGEHVVLKGLDQILWPDHCVQGTHGAEFSSSLHQAKIDRVFFKGTQWDLDSYSAFFDNGHLNATGLGDYLKKKGVTDLYIAGLTTDYCVKFSTLDAIDLGFKTYVVLDACKPVNLDPGDEARAIEEMKAKGAVITSYKEVLNP